MIDCQERFEQDYNDKVKDLNEHRSGLGTMELCIKLQDAGIAAKRIGKYEEAIEYYKESIQLNPNNGSSYYALGKTLYLAKKYEQAQKAYVLAYLNNANVFDANLFKHLGHAILDADTRNQKRYQLEIEHYAKTIAGQSFNTVETESARKYDKKCHNEAKDTFNSLKRKYEETVL